MSNVSEIMANPAFQRLLRKRSLLRWGFSITLVGAYLGFGILGLIVPDVFAAPFMQSSVPWGMAIGFFLIGASIVMSMIYVRLINKLEAENSFSCERPN